MLYQIRGFLGLNKEVSGDLMGQIQFKLEEGLTTALSEAFHQSLLKTIRVLLV